MPPFLKPSVAYAHAALAQRQMGATRPIASMIAVLVGGLIAILLVPESDWQPAGALRASGIAMTAGLMFSVILAAFRNPIALFRAELILMAGLVYWLIFDAVQARYAISAQRTDVVLLFTGVTIFGVLFWVGSAITSAFGNSRFPMQPATPPLGRNFLFWSAVACALMGLSYKTLSCKFQVGCLYEGLLLPRFTGSWILDPSFSPLKRLRPAGYLALPLTVAYFMVERKLTWKGVIAALLAFFNVLLLLMDGRRAMGTTLGAGVLIYVLLQYPIRLRHLLTLVGLLALILLVLEAMLAWRNYGIGRSFLADRPIDTGHGVFAVDRNFYHCTRAMSVVPALHEHTGWAGVSYNVGYLIPYSLWKRPGKIGFDYARITGRRGRPGWTATYSIIGDLWVIGGIIAIAAGGLFYGVLANLASRMLLIPVSVRSRLLYAALIMALFVSLRAMHELIGTGLAALALWGLYKMRDLVPTKTSMPTSLLQKQSGSPTHDGSAP